MWGIEDPYRETNAHELYRYGERGLLNRYIVPPSDVLDKRRAREGRPLLGNTAYKLLKPGVAVEDVVVAIVIVALLAFSAYAALGPAMDRCLDAMGV